MIPIRRPSFTTAREELNYQFLHHSTTVHPPSWQGMSTVDKPELRTHELVNVVISVGIHAFPDLFFLGQDIGPNLPWVDNHFEERVCGMPLNPGQEWKNWPYAKSAERFLDKHGQFNHSYMERLWPRYAGMTEGGVLGPVDDRGEPTIPEDLCLGLSDRFDPHFGIRFEYGDLRSIIDLLLHENETRQAWIPLFFPEDTGRGDGGRKPCTLGYQFMVRNNEMHIYYPLRSCDFIRHWADDVYLAVRLARWVIEECRKIDDWWNDVVLGEFVMHCTSLHIFANDFQIMKNRHG